MIKVAISGQMRTGKNTLAEMIAKFIPRNIILGGYPEYEIVAVADPIKRMVLEMIPDADPKCLYGESELRSRTLPGNLKDSEGYPLTYRKLLMDLGKQGRSYHPDIWLNALIKNAEKKEKLQGLFIADARFPNELSYLKNNGFYMIRITRKDSPKINDISETAQLDIPDSFFHRVVENNSSLEDLMSVAKDIHKIASL